MKTMSDSVSARIWSVIAIPHFIKTGRYTLQIRTTDNISDFHFSSVHYYGGF